MPLGICGVSIDAEVRAVMGSGVANDLLPTWAKQRIRESAARPWQQDGPPPARAADLLRAAVYNDVVAVLAALNSVTGEDKQALVNVRNTEGECVLSLAAKTGLVAVVKILLANGAQPDMMSVLGTTPLHEACRLADMHCIQLLFRIGWPQSFSNANF